MAVAYCLKLHKIVLARDVTCTAHHLHLLTCLYLPLRVHSKQNRAPRQQVRSRVFPCKEKTLALFHNVINRYIHIAAAAAAAAVRSPNHKPQQILRPFRIFLPTRILFSSIDQLHQRSLHFLIQFPRI